MSPSSLVESTPLFSLRKPQLLVEASNLPFLAAVELTRMGMNRVAEERGSF